ncbi:hypothetical protein Tco_0682427 [Tanacetum coccineum]|uniref:Uncharacterized protein n=1 Tax=Tanacetum coccineum TaxID=301880 RepID=A0ABQ4XR47_9ASTR
MGRPNDSLQDNDGEWKTVTRKQRGSIKDGFFNKDNIQKTGSKHRISNFDKAVVGDKPKSQPIHIEEDKHIRARLDGCWTGKEKNLQEAARACMEENLTWLNQWFDNLNPWEEKDLNTGRLTWVCIEGLPIIGRHNGAIKSIYGGDQIKRSLSITLNGIEYCIWMFEEQYSVSSLLNPCRDSDSDVNSMFEEEFIGPIMMEDDVGEDGFSDAHSLRISGNKKVHVSPSPCNKSKGRLEGDFFYGEHANSKPSMQVPMTPHWILMFLQRQVDSLHPRIKNLIQPNLLLLIVPGLFILCALMIIPPNLRINPLLMIWSVPDLNVTLDKDVLDDHSDKDLDTLMASFQKFNEKGINHSQVTSKKRRVKTKNRKLKIVGSSSSQPYISQHDTSRPSDENDLLKQMGAQLGISSPQGKDGSKSS